MHVWYINLKLLTKFHTIWPKINGHMDLEPITYTVFARIISAALCLKLKSRVAGAPTTCSEEI